MKPIKDKFILLFFPNPTKGGRRVAPLPLLAISSFLEKNYDIRIFHSYDKEDYLEVLEHLDKAVCVGISAITGYQITDGLNFAKLVRQKNNKVSIIWGGVHPTIRPIETIKNSYVDIVVKGQGEEAFAELVRALDKNQPIDNILGIVYKKDGKIINNPDRPYKSINEFPSIPYYVLGDLMERFIKNNAYAEKNLIYLTSAGCPFRCRFCYLGNASFERKYDPYPAERVVEDLKKLVDDYKINGIEFRDSNFFVNEQRCREIFLGVIKAGLKLKISMLNGRANQLGGFGDDFWQLMKDAGVVEVVIGAESGDQEMLDYIDKKISIDDILECQQKAKKFNLGIINSFMTGFPILEKNLANPKKQLQQELNRTIDLVRKLFEINPMADIFLFFYTPYPGSYFYEESVKAGFKDPQSLEEWGEIDLDIPVVPWITDNHKKKVLFLRDLFVFKKIFSDEYLEKKASKSKKIYWFKKLRLNKIIIGIIDFRLRFKIFCCPVEKSLFPLIKMFK